MADGADNCRLTINFSGLAVFAKDGQRAVVLQPDARENDERANNWGMRHLDGKPAKAHLGYLSFALKHLVQGAAGEVVVKLDREAVTFDGLDDDATDDRKLDLPDFGVFAPVWTLSKDLLGTAPSSSLLARVHLPGGQFFGGNDGMERTMTRVLTSPTSLGHQQASKTFMNSVGWARDLVGASKIALLLTSFDRQKTRRFELNAVDGAITLKIANLCADNPLEWSELTPNSSEAEKPLEDLDFKWLSILFSAKGTEISPTFDGHHEVPYLRRMPDDRQGLIYNCFPARGTFG